MPEADLLSLEQALKAQSALRSAAGLGPEQFPIQAFVGMISDEIEALRERGKTDADIANLIRANSSINITSEQIAAFYAPPDDRQGH